MTQEDVIKGLECLAKQHGIVGVCEPENCPYGDLHTCANEIARDAIALLKAQEPTKFQIKTTISNVNIPKGVDEEQFFAVLSAQYAALAKLYGDDVPTYSPS